MESIGLLSMFLICAYDDLKSKSVRTIVIVIFGIIGIVINILYRNNNLLSIAGGVGMGGLVYLFSNISNEKIGKGDALIVMVIGLYLGFYKTIEVLWIASVVALAVGLIKIKIVHADKNYEMPFVPFLLGGYICTLLIGRF